MQILPDGQSVADRHSPATQPPETQMWSAPYVDLQTLSVAQSVQRVAHADLAVAAVQIGVAVARDAGARRRRRAAGRSRTGRRCPSRTARRCSWRRRRPGQPCNRPPTGSRAAPPIPATPADAADATDARHAARPGRAAHARRAARSRRRPFRRRRPSPSRRPYPPRRPSPSCRPCPLRRPCRPRRPCPPRRPWPRRLRPNHRFRPSQPHRPCPPRRRFPRRRRARDCRPVPPVDCPPPPPMAFVWPGRCRRTRRRTGRASEAHSPRLQLGRRNGKPSRRWNSSACAGNLTASVSSGPIQGAEPA